MEILIFLALIPLAVGAFFFLGGLSRLLLPYFVGMGGLALGFLLSKSAEGGHMALVFALVGVAGFVWMWARWDE